MITESPEPRFDVAIIGMSVRFPGARNLKEFWRNLTQGVESIRRFTDEELLQRGVARECIEDPSYIKAAPVLDDTDQFAAPFFGYPPREAELMDPQHRLFLECAWEALEDSGCAPRHLPGQTGVFAGVSLSSYLLFNLADHPGIDPVEENFQVMIGSDKDFLATRLSYKLNLKGPSLTIQTGCSTSLVAAHLAVQNLLTYQCDLAIIGGVSIGVPQRTGYYYRPGGISSPDGHCRAFDADAQGTVFGEGIGVVILKRLEDALADKNHIYAVIKGSAINNDGADKIGYTAPGFNGQVDVISRAQAIARVPADTVSYIETHGTATALGDPIEIEALSEVFRKYACKPGSCAIGSVKTNIGHLDAAAGVAGLVKTALMLKNRELVPSLHFRNANPKIHFEQLPFYVNTEHGAWTSSQRTLRAGVSSFGIGGTNAHVILEEAPDRADSQTNRPMQLICVSAQTDVALEQATANLAAALEQTPSISLANVAFTLHTGREEFEYRRALVCSDVAEAITLLRELPPDRVWTERSDKGSKDTVFMFPGGGAQYVGMGDDLYRAEPAFRREIDRCAKLLVPHLGYDIKTLLYPSAENLEFARREMLRPSVALPALLATEYAIAMLFMQSWGIKPACMIGHSLGEYTAACLAGVFSLEDVLRLVVYRARLLDSLPQGSMISVNCTERELPVMPAEISVAAVNTPGQCVLSGPVHLIEQLSESLKAQEIEFHQLHIEIAAHCSMVDSVMEQFRNFMRGIRLSEPQLPFVSNLSGDWITPSQCTDVNYWAAHLRHTVRFAQGLETIGQKGRYVLLELGPGRTLSTFANQQLRTKGSIACSAMRHPHDTVPELRTTYATLSRLWTLGMNPNWRNFYADEMRCCVPLPTYPFERRRYWIAPVPGGVTHRKKGAPTLERHLYGAIWMPAPLLTQQQADAGCRWIILADQLGLGRECARILEKAGQSVAIVHCGSSFEVLRQGEYQVNAKSEQDLNSLLQQLSPIHESSVKVLHCWSLRESRNEASERNFFHESQESGIYSLLSLTRAIAQLSYAGQWQLSVIGSGAVQLNGGEELAVEQAGLQAAITVIPQEYQNIRCRLIDIGKQALNTGATRRLSEQIIAEAAQKEMRQSSVVAYRGLQRWIHSYAPLETAAGANDCRLNGKPKTYLITGGLGTLGLVLARHLAGAFPCHIVLTTRTKFPERKFWSNPAYLAQEDGTVREKIEKLNDIEKLGSKVLVATADVANRIQMETLMSRVEAEFGPLDGVIHLAGITGEKALRLSSDLQPAECEAQFRPKVDGCYVLKEVLHDRMLDFCLVFSSTASVLGGPGMLAYAAASCFLDACAATWCLNGQRWISINWDAWVPEKTSPFIGMHESALDRYALPYSTALNLFDLITAKVPGGPVVVSSYDVNARVDEWTNGAFSEAGKQSKEAYGRPELQTDYVAPETVLQKEIAAIWSAALGIEQIGIHDNLFELGGNSLIGLRIVARLKKELAIEIPVSALFEGPTVSTLSQLIESSGRTELYAASRNRGELRRRSRSTVRSGVTA